MREKRLLQRAVEGEEVNRDLFQDECDEKAARDVKGFK